MTSSILSQLSHRYGSLKTSLGIADDAARYGADGNEVAALFVTEGGCYFNVAGVDPWDKNRDARLYAGPHPVVAHPPCQLWTRFAHVNFVRWGGEHNRPGNDGGCFAAALAAVRQWGAFARLNFPNENPGPLCSEAGVCDALTFDVGVSAHAPIKQREA